MSFASLTKGAMETQVSGTTPPNPEYYFPYEIIKLTGMGHSTLKKCLDKNILPSVLKDGRRMIEAITVENLRKEWKSSCSQAKAARTLRVEYSTVKAWLKNGKLNGITVLGKKRVVLDSVKDMARRRKLGTYSAKSRDPNFGFPFQILQITAIDYRALQECLRNKSVPSVLKNGQRMIPNETIEKIRSTWQSSCWSIDAARILGIHRITARKWLKNGKLELIRVLGKERVALRSLVIEIPPQKERLVEYLASERKKLKKRLNKGREKAKKRNKMLALRKRASAPKKQNRFLCKKESPRKPVFIPIPDYEARPVKVPGFESRRLTSCEEAVKATGRSLTDIKDMYRAGKIRGELVDEQIFIYMSSLQIIKEKLRNGTVR